MAPPSAGLSVRLLFTNFPHRLPRVPPNESNVGASLLSPPSACAVEYQQRHSAFGFMSSLPGIGRSRREKLMQSAHLLPVNTAFPDILLRSVNVRIIQWKRVSSGMTKPFRRRSGNHMDPITIHKTFLQIDDSLFADHLCQKYSSL